MGYKRMDGSEFLLIASRIVLVALAVWGVQVDAAENDRDGHLMPIVAMDHSAMSMPASGEGAMSDMHAHHHQMMQRQGYQRSEHRYAAPELSLTDMQGRTTSLAQLLDTPQPVLLNFIFTTCTTICPVLSATFSQIQSELGARANELRMVSVTIDPEQDTPEVLRRYAEHYDAGPQWRFLTGDMASIIAVQKAFDIYRGSKTNHEPITLLRGPGQTAWVRIEGIASASDVLTEYANLRAEKP